MMNYEFLRNFNPKAELARRNYIDFVQYTMPSYDAQWFHKYVCKKLDEFERGGIKKLMVLMPPQHGKALQLETDIPTPSGWVKVKNLKVGDTLFDENGNVCHVKAVSPIWRNRDCYRVVTDDGHEVIADESHEWQVRLCRKHKKESIHTTKYLAERTSSRAAMVRPNGALVMPHADLLIHPYVLGVWLGDGASNNATISAHDNDAMHTRALIESFGYQTKDRATKFTFGINGLKSKLKQRGLINNKHIPSEYMRGSMDQRLQLLNGLIDTDGYVAKDGQVEFCSTNKALADGVRELVHSLGYKASMIVGEATLNGKYISDKWRVMFYMPNVATLPRKSNRCRQPKKVGRYLKFEYAGKHDTVCIEVDSKSHLFLCGKGMIPTHNSELTTRRFPPYLLGKNPHRRIAVVSYSDEMSNNFNRVIQRNIDSPEYLELFPNTKLNHSKHHSIIELGKARNTYLIDVLHHGGSIRTIGAQGAITGNPVDIFIYDDLYKDREQARSEAHRRSLRDQFNDVFRPRQHNNSQELLVMTPWDEEDVSQWLIRREDDWTVIKLPSIKENDNYDYDPRGIGEALWESKHSIKRLLEVKSRSIVTFNALYQCDPKPNTDVLIFGHFKECESLPDGKVFWGCDFGYTNDPTAIVKCIRQDSRIFIKECCYEPCGDENGIKAILASNGYHAGEPVYCDHDNELIAAMRRVGIAALQANKSRHAGIAKVNSFEVYFTRDSHNIRNERNRYQYVTYGEVVTNEPAEGYDHLMDATRYAIYTHSFRW